MEREDGVREGGSEREGGRKRGTEEDGVREGEGGREGGRKGMKKRQRE